MEKGNNLRVYCSAVAFAGVRGILEKILETNYTINQTQTKDKTGKIVSEVIRVAQKESRRNEAIITINVFRTISSFLINRPQIQKFLLELLPVVQSWATENTVDINIKDDMLKNVLSKMKYKHQSLKVNKNKRKHQEYNNKILKERNRSLQLIEEIMKKDRSLKKETVHKYYQHK